MSENDLGFTIDARAAFSTAKPAMDAAAQIIRTIIRATIVEAAESAGGMDATAAIAKIEGVLTEQFTFRQHEALGERSNTLVEAIYVKAAMETVREIRLAMVRSTADTNKKADPSD